MIEMNRNKENAKNMKLSKERKREMGWKIREGPKKEKKGMIEKAINGEVEGMMIAPSNIPQPMQFQAGRFPLPQGGQYYHQFLVPLGKNMPPPTLFPLIQTMLVMNGYTSV
uniref:Uncharacterized protein n=1 Tax=Romanomermis culicivorax TaxID=13658 RepID=A0A915IHE3_ROMCU